MDVYAKLYGRPSHMVRLIGYAILKDVGLRVNITGYVMIES
jgi:hypothetical protein